jgi:hypothetical protein
MSGSIMKKKIGLGILIVFIALQFIRTDGELTHFEDLDNFIVQTNPPADIQKMLKTAYYDTHTNPTKTPWYGQIAPVSWYINAHRYEEKEALNFNAWGTYQIKKHKIEKCWEELEKEKMPLADYLHLHDEAQRANKDQQRLITWLKSLDLNPPKETQNLSLNNGEKWTPNQETTVGVYRMFAILSGKVDAESLTLYAEMGKDLNLVIKTIFVQCTMKADGQDQLHGFLIPLVKKFRELETIVSFRENYIHKHSFK